MSESKNLLEQLLNRFRLFRLCRALRNRNVLVRRQAAQTLGELGDPAGVPCLERMLKAATDEYVIRWSLNSLQTIGTPAAIDALTLAMFGTNQRIAGLAAQSLARIPDTQAQTVFTLRDILSNNDWDALSNLGENAQRPLAAILRSEQYAAWPSGKRKQLLAIAAKMGVKSTRHSDEMIDMGLFMSGIHTIGDLTRGLNHRSPKVRIAAAEKLASAGQT